MIDETDDSVSPILSGVLSTSVSLSTHLVSVNPPVALISGSVSPSQGSPVNVTLENSDSEGVSYQEMARITTAANGTFAYSWNLTRAGTFVIRAHALGLESSSVSLSTSNGFPGFPPESLLVGGVVGILVAIC